MWQRVMSYVWPKSKDGSKFIAGFPTPSGEVVEILFTFIDGMLLGDGSKLIETLSLFFRHVNIKGHTIGDATHR